MLMQQNPAAIKAQASSAELQQKHANDMELEDRRRLPAASPPRASTPPTEPSPNRRSTALRAFA